VGILIGTMPGGRTAKLDPVDPDRAWNQAAFESLGLPRRSSNMN
jgi:hypothetical protein